MSSGESPLPRGGRIRAVGATVAMLAACFAALIAFATNGILSTGESGSHESTLLIVQLIVGVVGLVPAGLFARALVRRSDLHAVVWLGASVVVYLGWGVLNDAAVHGWANLTVF